MEAKIAFPQCTSFACVCRLPFQHRDSSLARYMRQHLTACVTAIHVMHGPVPISLIEPRESREPALILSPFETFIALFMKVVVYFCFEVRRQSTAVKMPPPPHTFFTDLRPCIQAEIEIIILKKINKCKKCLAISNCLTADKTCYRF